VTRKNPLSRVWALWWYGEESAGFGGNEAHPERAMKTRGRESPGTRRRKALNVTMNASSV
jgi:hypothetical protein